MKEAVSVTGGKENATQLLTQYGLLSNGLGSTTSSEDDREPQPEQPAGERASEAEAEQIVSQHRVLHIIPLRTSFTQCNEYATTYMCVWSGK